jgi:hypothetical protein
LFSLPIEMAISRQTLEVVEDRFNLRIDFPVCRQNVILGGFFFIWFPWLLEHARMQRSILVWKKEM